MKRILQLLLLLVLASRCEATIKLFAVDEDAAGYTYYIYNNAGSLLAVNGGNATNGRLFTFSPSGTGQYELQQIANTGGKKKVRYFTARDSAMVSYCMGDVLVAELPGMSSDEILVALGIAALVLMCVAQGWKLGRA